MVQTRFGLTGKGVRGLTYYCYSICPDQLPGIFSLWLCRPWKVHAGIYSLGCYKGYVPFDISEKYVPHFYGIVFTLFAMFYSIIGGMHSIVTGDVIKYMIMTMACIAIAVIAMQHLQGQTLNVPEGWDNPFFSWQLNLDWTAIAADANKKIASDGFSLFGAFFMMMLFKGVFASLAGPAPNYDMQKVLSTRSPKEASKMTGFVSIILIAYPLFHGNWFDRAGIAVL